MNVHDHSLNRSVRTFRVVMVPPQYRFEGTEPVAGAPHGQEEVNDRTRSPGGMFVKAIWITSVMTMLNSAY